MKVKIISAIVLIIGFVLLGAYADTHATDTLTLKQAWDLLDSYEKSHQQVVDHPEMLDDTHNGLLGTVEFHAQCVKEYQALKAFILKGER